MAVSFAVKTAFATLPPLFPGGRGIASPETPPLRRRRNVIEFLVNWTSKAAGGLNSFPKRAVGIRASNSTKPRTYLNIPHGRTAAVGGGAARHGHVGYPGRSARPNVQPPPGTRCKHVRVSSRAVSPRPTVPGNGSPPRPDSMGQYLSAPSQIARKAAARRGFDPQDRLAPLLALRMRARHSLRLAPHSRACGSEAPHAGR